MSIWHFCTRLRYSFKKIHNIITLPRRYRTTFIIVSCCSLSYDWSIVFTWLCCKCCYKLYYTKNRKSINLSKDFQIEFHYKMPAFGMCDIVATQKRHQRLYTMSKIFYSFNLDKFNRTIIAFFVSVNTCFDKSAESISGKSISTSQVHGQNTLISPSKTSLDFIKRLWFRY